MIGGFCLFLYLGHVPMVCLIFVVQGLMVRELFALAAGAYTRPLLSST